MSMSVMVVLLAPRRFNEGMDGFLAGLHGKEGSMKVCVFTRRSWRVHKDHGIYGIGMECCRGSMSTNNYP